MEAVHGLPRDTLPCLCVSAAPGCRASSGMAKLVQLRASPGATAGSRCAWPGVAQALGRQGLTRTCTIGRAQLLATVITKAMMVDDTWPPMVW